MIIREIVFDRRTVVELLRDTFVFDVVRLMRAFHKTVGEPVKDRILRSDFVRSSHICMRLEGYVIIGPVSKLPVLHPGCFITICPADRESFYRIIRNLFDSQTAGLDFIRTVACFKIGLIAGCIVSGQYIFVFVQLIFEGRITSGRVSHSREHTLHRAVQIRLAALNGIEVETRK